MELTIKTYKKNYNSNSNSNCNFYMFYKTYKKLTILGLIAKKYVSCMIKKFTFESNYFKLTLIKIKLFYATVKKNTKPN